jgi:hypothetical protein
MQVGRGIVKLLSEKQQRPRWLKLWQAMHVITQPLLSHDPAPLAKDLTETRIAKAPEIVLPHQGRPCCMFAATKSQSTPEGNQFVLVLTP